MMALSVALGRIAFDAVAKAYDVDGRFAHGLEAKVTSNVTLLASYHPSRQNVNTRRLTQRMLDDVFRRAAELV